MNSIKIIFSIFNHPLNKYNRFNALIRFIKWQIFSKFYNYPVLLPFSDTSSYLCWKGLTGVTGNWYFGLMEMEEMSFASHFLKLDDVFYDIGANVGAYSLLTSQHVGCRVFCFEPHPTTFQHLLRNINIQKKQGLITAFNFGLGSEKSIVNFTTNLDTVNHVSLNSNDLTITVEINILDNLNLPMPSLIKIDVEGFEYNVLQGAFSTLENLNLKAIIIELNGSGNQFGINDKDIDIFLRSFNFEPYTYDPFKRQLIKLNTYLNHNTIYIRDIEYCQNRVNNSLPLKLSNGYIL